MNITPREGEKFYNEALSVAFKEAYERSDIGMTALSEILDMSPNTLRKYLQLRRSIVRSDYERKIVVVVRLLNEMCDRGILPLNLDRRVKNRGDKHIKVFNDYLDSIS